MTDASAAVGHSMRRFSGGSSTISTNGAPADARQITPLRIDNRAKLHTCKHYLLSPKSIDIIVSSPPRFANCGGERAGLELTAKEPGGIHGSRQRYAACGGALKSHARIVRFVADQDDELPAGRLRSLQRAHD